MTLNYRRKRRSVSGTLLVTFVLGIGIGFTLCYALMEMVRVDDAASVERMREAAKPPETPTPVAPVAPPPPPVTAPPEATVEPEPPALVESWPARHLFIGVTGVRIDDTTHALLKTFTPGGVVLRTENVEDAAQTRALADEIRIAATPALPGAAAPIIASFLAGGAINPLKLDEAPPPREIAVLEDVNVVRDLGKRIGQACRERGVDLVFGPPLDIFKPGVTDPSIEAMTFANDDVRVTAVGLALAAGVIEAGVPAIPSHYPGEGSAVVDTTGVRVVREQDLSALEVLFRPFDAAAQLEMPGLLVGFTAVPALEGDGPLVPAAFSEKLVRKFLRDMRSFEGVLFADDISNAALLGGRTAEQAAVAALAAGCDAVLLLDADAERLTLVCNTIAAATRDGKLNKDDLDAAAERLDQLRERITPAPPEAASAEENVQPGTTEETAPAAGVTHTVREGETLSSIALLHGVSVPDLQQWNNLGNSAIIKLGQELHVRAPEQAPESEPPPEEPEPAPAAEESPAPAQTPAGVPAEAPETPTEAESAETAPSETPEADSTPAPMPEEPAEIESAEAAPPASPAEETVTTPGPPEEVAPPPESPVEETAAAAMPEPPKQEEPQPDLPPGTAPPNTEHRVYRIAPGDTLDAVAKQYGVEAEEIRRWNGLSTDRLIPGGQLDIYLPVAAENTPAEATDFDYYRVTGGDTLHSIALRYGTTVQELLKHNKIPNPNVLLEGQRIKIPKSP